MGNAPSSSPAPQSVLWTIHAQGQNADLSFLRTQEVNKDLERKHLARLSGAQLRELSAQIDRWTQAQTPETLKEQERVTTMHLLQELRMETTPSVLIDAQEMLEGQVDVLKHTGGKILNKFSGDAIGMVDSTIPWQDKVVTGVKYVAGAIGLTWLVSWLNEKWHETTGDSWFSHTFKWLGAIGLGIAGANVYASTTDRSTGPRLVNPSTKTTVSATTVVAPTSAPASGPAAPQGILAMSGLPSKGNIGKFLNRDIPMQGGRLRFVGDATDRKILIEYNGARYELMQEKESFSHYLFRFQDGVYLQEDGDAIQILVSGREKARFTLQDLSNLVNGSPLETKDTAGNTISITAEKR